MATVIIKKGVIRGKQITNKTFTLVKDYQVGAATGQGFVTIDAMKMFGNPTARVYVKSLDDFTIEGLTGKESVKKPSSARREFAANKTIQAVSSLEDDSIPDEETKESDDQILSRINRRFDILNKLTLGARRGDIRSMFVCGAPGVGKTFGVETTLDEANIIEKFEGSKKRYEIVSGAMTPIGLYMKLYEYSDENCVLVLDDCDMVFTDEIALNLLKAALDTSEHRKIYWNVDSKALAKTGVPNDFEFKGSVIFISNINFKKVRGERLRAHLTALMSRSFFLDLTVHTFREKMLRITDVVENKHMLDKFHLSEKCKNEIISFLNENAKCFNELSLRTVLKLAGIAKTTDERKDEWQEIAQMSLMGNIMSY